MFFADICHMGLSKTMYSPESTGIPWLILQLPLWGTPVLYKPTVIWVVSKSSCLVFFHTALVTVLQDLSGSLDHSPHHHLPSKVDAQSRCFSGVFLHLEAIWRAFIWVAQNQCPMDQPSCWSGWSRHHLRWPWSFDQLIN